VAEKFDYEEVNLSTPAETTIHREDGTLHAGHMAWALESGAPDDRRSRHRRQRQPETEVKITVNPPPLQTLDTSTGAMVGDGR
jgi:hypothetical protein